MSPRPFLRAAAFAGPALLAFLPAAAQDFDVKAHFAGALASGRTGMAEKTRMVDAKPAMPGEVVVTIIRSEGVETKSKPAEAGDMVVRNRCPETGNEQYLVKAASFAKRYGEPAGEADRDGWRPYKPTGTPMRFLVLEAVRRALSPSRRPGARAWWRSPATRSCRIRQTPPTPTASPPPPSPAPTR